MGVERRIEKCIGGVKSKIIQREEEAEEKREEEKCVMKDAETVKRRSESRNRERREKCREI